jgi:hypothetical protein
MAGRQPNLYAARDRDHLRRLIFANELSAALTIKPSTAPVQQ